MDTSSEAKFFDYGLSTMQEERAERLHKESIIIDMLPMGPVGPAAYTTDMAKQIIDDYERDHDYLRNTYLARELPMRMAAHGKFPVYKESVIHERDFTLYLHLSQLFLC